jgi:hypothetical protein
MSLLPPSTCTYVMLVANSLEENCFDLLVVIVENWIHDMAERFQESQGHTQLSVSIVFNNPL